MLMEILGIDFKDTKLIKQALTHPSSSKDNYQRLEFLGDSLLDFLVGEYLFKNSNEGEGRLTVLRSYFVNEEYLAERFDAFDLAKNVIVGKSMKNNVTRAVKADIMESIVAAVYLEKGIDVTRQFVIDKLQLANFNDVQDTNYKTQLQELVQANFKCTMKYVTEIEDSTFVSRFYMDEDEISTGFGKDKLTAEQNAAYVAINKLFKDEEE